MQPARAHAASPWSKSLASQLSRKPFRDAYLADKLRTGIAFQVRALREQRGWSQAELAERAKTSQSAIARIENPDYGRVSLQTLLELASEFDVALLVQFVDWADWLTRMANVSPDALRKDSFKDEQLAPEPDARVIEILHLADALTLRAPKSTSDDPHLRQALRYAREGETRPDLRLQGSLIEQNVAARRERVVA